MMKQSLDFLGQRVQEIDLRAEQEEIINHYREKRKRIIQVECAGEFAPSAKLREIIITIEQEQDYEIDLKDAVGLR